MALRETTISAIGQRDRQITIQQEDAGTPNDFGHTYSTWSTYSQPWAALLRSPQGEGTEGDKKVSYDRLTFQVEYDSGVTVAMRISYNSNTYQILSIEEVKRGRLMNLRARSTE